MSNATPSKTVVEVLPDTHERLKKAAKSSPYSVKRFASTLLDYALDKVEEGNLKVTEPSVIVTPEPNAAH